MPKRIQATPPKPADDDLQRRLAVGGFRLEKKEGHHGYVVYNRAGYVVFGMIPYPYSATFEQVENFLQAQEL